jgi:hypothetical protein
MQRARDLAHQRDIEEERIQKLRAEKEEKRRKKKEQAEREMVDLFNSCPPDVQQAFSYIKMDITKLYDYYKE